MTKPEGKTASGRLRRLIEEAAGKGHLVGDMSHAGRSQRETLIVNIADAAVDAGVVALLNEEGGNLLDDLLRLHRLRRESNLDEYWGEQANQITCRIEAAAMRAVEVAAQGIEVHDELIFADSANPGQSMIEQAVDRAFK